MTIDPTDFMSGTSGEIFGIRATTHAVLADAYIAAVAALRAQPWRLRRAARSWPRRRVLVLAIERAAERNLLAGAREELLRTRHDVAFASSAAGDRGRFENLNQLLRSHPAEGYDWLLVVDDDVTLPAGFLDVFIFLAERFQLRLAQPAHKRRSHAAWKVTRRQPGSIARETGFVEIGPVVAFHYVTFGLLLPFPELRVGWGLDAHWSAVAQQQGWRIGVIDAAPVAHRLRRIATSYPRDAAIAEGQEFLSGKPYADAAAAQRTLATHRAWS